MKKSYAEAGRHQTRMARMARMAKGKRQSPLGSFCARIREGLDAASAQVARAFASAHTQLQKACMHPPAAIVLESYPEYDTYGKSTGTNYLVGCSICDSSLDRWFE